MLVVANADNLLDHLFKKIVSGSPIRIINDDIDLIAVKG